jgi:formamidopyrimidine-DNA glycosylase
MPELPDITLYVEAIGERVREKILEAVRLGSPFLLRTAVPPLASVEGRQVVEVRRLGKRIALGLEGELWLVLHLMIAGRLHWKSRRPSLGGKNALAALDFAHGSLLLTEAGTKRRASLHVLQGETALRAQDPGGLEPLSADLSAFETALTRRNHTLKRALTDPNLFSGIGNSYSDEILHRAGLSPVALTQRLPPTDVERLFEATRATLREWTDRLRAETGDAFPEGVTAFRPDMAVHGRYGLPCPVCAAPVQRIRYAENETNYCAGCQTGGKVLADRALSRLLREDWPRTIEQWEASTGASRSGTRKSPSEES